MPSARSAEAIWNEATPSRQSTTRPDARSVSLSDTGKSPSSSHVRPTRERGPAAARRVARQRRAEAVGVGAVQQVAAPIGDLDRRAPAARSARRGRQLDDDLERLTGAQVGRSCSCSWCRSPSPMHPRTVVAERCRALVERSVEVLAEGCGWRRPVRRRARAGRGRARSPGLQIWRTVRASWVTNTIVRPSSWNCLIRLRHFAWNSSSPTASTSSTRSTSGSRLTATAKPEAHVHARGVVLDRLVDELRQLGEVDDVVEHPVDVACGRGRRTRR